MPRMARVVIPGIPHHVTQRGNRREQTFFTNGDYLRFLDLLGEYSGRERLEILAYCLMPNHIHLVVIPPDAQSLAAALKPVHLRYAQHVNWMQGINGRLWQGRFFSCPLDGRHLWTALKYVENNPVRANLAEKAELYPWSSAAGHAGKKEDLLLKRNLQNQWGITDWSEWLREDEDEKSIIRLRQLTRTGRPAGDKSFIRRLEKISGRCLAPKRGGRPHKPLQDG